MLLLLVCCCGGGGAATLGGPCYWVGLFTFLHIIEQYSVCIFVYFEVPGSFYVFGTALVLQRSQISSTTVRNAGRYDMPTAQQRQTSLDSVWTYRLYYSYCYTEWLSV